MNGDNQHIERPAQDDERLDLVIDAVAREMTEAEPSGALRARVFEQIGSGRRHPSPAMSRWAWAGAAAAVVLAVATGVWVLNRPLGPPEEPARFAASRPSAPPEPAVATQPAAASPMAPPEAGPPLRTRRATASRTTPPVEDDTVEDTHPVPALAEIDPLRFTAVEPEPLQIADVDVTPLPAMSAIDIPGLGPDSNDLRSADPNKEK